MTHIRKGMRFHLVTLICSERAAVFHYKTSFNSETNKFILKFTL